MGKKLAFAGLALASIFAVGMFAGNEAKASARLKVFRFACTPSSFIVVPADGLWHTVAAVTVSNRLAGGNVYVTGSGMSFMTPSGVVAVTLNTAPDSRGPWIATYSAGDSAVFGAGFESWSLSNCFFNNAAGPNTFFLNAFDFGGTGSESVECCSLAAFAVQNPLTEDCSFTGQVGHPGQETGPSNVR